VETAVIVPFEQWGRMQRPNHANVQEWLLAPEARTEQLTPPPLAWELRPPPRFD